MGVTLFGSAWSWSGSSGNDRHPRVRPAARACPAAERAEIIKQHQRTINKAVREIERERRRMEASEGKVIADIKKAAKDGQMGAARVMAKDLVRTRQHVQKMYKMKTQLQAISLRIQTIKSQAAMANAMKGTTRAMMRMNRQINLPSLQHIMMEFQKQSEMMDLKEETIGDTSALLVLHACRARSRVSG